MKIVIIIASILITMLFLYLWLIAPRIVARPDMAVFDNKYFAHRGLHSLKKGAPENSLKAFRRAVNAGYGIELDIQLSKDGIPIVFHDYTLERVCGVKGRVDEYTYEELKQFSLQGTEERIPKLSEVLHVVNGKVPMIIELKIEGVNAALCPIADKVLSDYKGPYCVESFNPFGLYWYRCNRGRIPRGQLADQFLKSEEYRDLKGSQRFLYFCLANLLLNFLGRPDFIAYNHKWLRKLPLRLCGWLGAVRAAWTIHSQEELDGLHVSASAGNKNPFSMHIFENFQPILDKL